MAIGQQIALFLSTDLRSLASDLEKVWRAQDVIHSNIREAASQADLPPFMHVRLELLREDIEESRDRLGAILETLTGRRPGR